MDSGSPRRLLRRLVARGARRMRRLDEAPHAKPEPTSDEALLMRAGLFDHVSYARLAGIAEDRERAAHHYLTKGAARGLHPHPLFDPAYFRSMLDDELAEELGDGDPFLFYLRRRPFRRHTHPLFNTQRYIKANPEALQHERGPIGHYDDIGAAAGLTPNAWLPVDDEGRAADLRQWLVERHDEWRARRLTVPRAWRGDHNSQREARYLSKHPSTADGAPTLSPTVSVVLNAGLAEECLRPTLEALAGQTRPAHEVVVVDRGAIAGLWDLVATALGDVPVSFVEVPEEQVSRGLEEAWRRATGSHVAFLDAADVWQPDRLRLLVGAIGDGALAADVLEGLAHNGALTYAADVHPEGVVRNRNAVDLARLLVSRHALEEVGGFDTSLLGAWTFDLVLRLAEHHRVAVVPVVGVRRVFRSRVQAHRPPSSRRDPADHPSRQSWADVVLNRRLVDWAALSQQPRDPSTVSVIIPTYDDWVLTWAAVESVVESDGVGGLAVEVLVYDNGSSMIVSATLAALAHKHDQVRVFHSPVNHGFALGNNLALAHARGDTVVFLNNDTTVSSDWLIPLTAALADDDVLGAQPLLLYPGGSIQSAGVAFPHTGGLPHAFLQGFPVEDASGVDRQRFHALTGAALMLRTDDAIALQGFDPLFTNGMEDVDVCQRLSARRAGYFTVRPESPVVHFESRTAGRYTKYMQNRLLYLDRWAGVDEPRDDVALWASAGYRVVDHQVNRHADWQDRRLCLPLPVLVRANRLTVAEYPPRLRWAIKNPAPPGPESETWGDTHFARAIAGALRQHGQEVVIDHRPEFERATSRHDDVSLVLRGLAPFNPTPEQVSIAWVISHPEMLSRAEAASYDRVVAASIAWAAQAARTWDIPVETMLQATDPALFHPDRAVPDTGHPVLFVGSSRKVFRPIVRDAVESGLALSVYGGLWGRFIPRHYVKGKYLDNLELGAAYRSAGIVLNDHWEDMRQQGFVSNRLFDAVASGARVVSDDVAGLEELFGRSVQVYRTAEDLVRLASMYEPDEVFGDDAERRAVAQRVHREHSFHARAARLVEIAVEARKRRGFTD
jgi:O-antigen biosynthesis protein